MDTQTWYYTLSTIAQTLAALLAFGAIFLILRLERLGNAIDRHKELAIGMLTIKAKYIRSYTVPRDENNPMPKILQDLKVFIREYKEYYSLGANASGSQQSVTMDLGRFAVREGQDKGDNGFYFVSNVRRNLDSYFEQRGKLIELVQQPGFLTVLTIIASIISLGMTTYVPTGWRVYILFSIVFMAILSIVKTVEAAWKVLDAIKRL